MTASGFLLILGHGLVRGSLVLLILSVATWWSKDRWSVALQHRLWLVALVAFVAPSAWTLDWTIQASTSSLPAPAVAAAAGSSTVGWSLPSLLALVWGVGAAGYVAAALLAYVRQVRRARAAQPASPALEAAAGRISAALGIACPVRLGLVADGAPCTLGWRRPQVLLPIGLPADQWETVLWHELGHVTRRDGLWAWWQLLIAAVFWFWPPVHWAMRRLEFLREAACDELAVRRGGVHPAAVAQALVHHARRLSAARVALIPALVRRSLLERRVSHLLAPHAGAGSQWATVPVGLVVLALATGGITRSIAGLDEQCTYSPALATSLLASYPEADLDDDGELTRREACEFQARLSRLGESGGDGASTRSFAGSAVGLCCDCGAPEPAQAWGQTEGCLEPPAPPTPAS